MGKGTNIGNFPVVGTLKGPWERCEPPPSHLSTPTHAHAHTHPCTTASYSSSEFRGFRETKCANARKLRDGTQG